jgi:dephospho-CoA kinase
MKKIGLTGNIGSGKTTVSNVFKTLGVPVFYADDEAKRLMVEDESLKNQLVNAFGAEIYDNNLLNRKYLSELAFNDESVLERLNAIVHPVVQNYFDDWCNQQSSAYVLKEAAILFESGTDKDLDAIICVKCPKTKRIERLLHRDSVSVEHIKLRMSKQWDEGRKAALSDFIIDNDGDTLVIPQVLEIHADLLK